MTQKIIKVHIGKISLDLKKVGGKGGVFAVDNDFKSVAVKRNLKFSTTNRNGEYLEVYAEISSLYDLIQHYNFANDFAEKYDKETKSHRGISVSFIPDEEISKGTSLSIDESNFHATKHFSELKGQLERERIKYSKLEKESQVLTEQNNNGKLEIERLSREFQAKEQNLEGRLRGYSGKQCLDISSDNGLEKTLNDNQESYIIAQEMVIQDVFEKTALKIDSVKPVKEPDNLASAKKQVEEKRKYVESHGIEAINDLPEHVRNSLLSEWGSAEKIVSDYTQERERAGSMEIPLRIATIGDKVLISVPIKTKSDSDLSRIIYDAFASFGFVSMNQRGESKVFERDKHPVLLMTGKKPGDVSKEFVEYVLGQTKESYPGVRFKPFFTEYFLDDEINPSDKGYEPEILAPETEKIDIISFIRERIGERELKPFCDKHGFNSGYLYMLKNGKRNLGPKILMKLSDALNIPEDEIKSRVR